MAYKTKGIPVPMWATGPNCDGCVWRNKCFGFAPPDGVTLQIENNQLKGWDYDSAKADVWFIGEALGPVEVSEGRPFRGASGWEFGKMLRESACGLERVDCYITNVVKCRPIQWTDNDKPYIVPASRDHKNITPPRAQQEECYNRYLRKELEHFNGRLIVTLGDIPLRALCGKSGIGTHRGSPQVSHPHGYKVVPMYHPAAVLYKIGHRNVTIQDLGRIPQHLAGDFIEQTQHTFNLHGLPLDLDPDCQMPTIDIETRRTDTVDEGELNPLQGDIDVFGICDDNKVCTVIPSNPTTWDGVKAYIESRPTLCNQYLYGFDAYWFIKKGIKITDKLYDTLAMHHVANSEGRHDLYTVQSEFAEHPIPNWKTKRHYRENKPLVCARDVLQTRGAFDGLKKFLYRQGQWDLYEKHVMPLQWVSLQMRLQGVKVDRTRMYKSHIVMQHQLRKYEKMLQGAVGLTFNWRSPKQLGELLYDRMQLKEKRKDGKRTTEKKALEELEGMYPQSKILKLIMKMRRIGKLDSTYFNMLLDGDARVYPQLLVQGTATGRLACKDPTIHNIPPGLARQIFITDDLDSVFITADYAQIEFLVWAWYGAEWEVLRRGWEGFDFHTMVAQLFFALQYDQVTKEKRHAAKFIDFGLIYGRGAPSIANANNIPVSRVEGYIKQFENQLPGAWDFRSRCVGDAKDHGFNETVFHRRRYFRPREVTKIYNFCPQSTAADITGRALIRLYAQIRDPVRLTPLTVHDSVTVQAPRELVRSTVALMTEVMTLPVYEMPAKAAGFTDGARFRVDVKVGSNWADYDDKTNPTGLKNAEEWMKENGI